MGFFLGKRETRVKVCAPPFSSLLSEAGFYRHRGVSWVLSGWGRGGRPGLAVSCVRGLVVAG